MTVLTTIPNGASNKDIRDTLNQMLTDVAALKGTAVLSLSGPLTFATSAAAGTLVAKIGNVPAGVTPTITPNDGRLVVAGSAGAWTVVVGMTAATAGTIALAVAATGANGASASVVVTAAASGNAAFTATQLAEAYKIYQRYPFAGGALNKGVATVPVTVNVTTLGVPQFRVRSSDGSTIVQAATALPAFTALGAQTLKVPIDARLGWYFLDLSGDGATWKDGTTPIGTGDNTRDAGQSLTLRRFSSRDPNNVTIAGAGSSVDPNTAVYATTDEGTHNPAAKPSWAVPSDGNAYNSAFAAEYLKQMVAVTGVNQGLFGHARGFQSIAEFAQPYGLDYPVINARSQEVGGWRFDSWSQGHNDASAGAIPSYFERMLTTYFKTGETFNSVPRANVTKIVSTIPHIYGGSAGYLYQPVRQAGKAWAEANNAAHVWGRDIQLSDAPHETQIGAMRWGREQYRALRPFLGLPHGNNGPVLAGATRTAGSANIVLHMTLAAGATALNAVGNPSLRFWCFAAGDTSSRLAYDATTPFTVSGTDITLKLASVPAGDVDIYWDLPFYLVEDGATDMIYDNLVDGDGITLGRAIIPNLDPITATTSIAVPANTALPTLEGYARNANSLHCYTGAWTGPANSFAYQWYYADTNAAIVGAIGATYAVTSVDVGHTIKCKVTAVNSAGNTSAFSAATIAVEAANIIHVGNDLIDRGSSFIPSTTAGFGQMMTGVMQAPYGDDIIGQGGDDWTLEFRFGRANNNNGLRVMTSKSNHNFWIGTTANGKLLINLLDGYLNGTDPGGGGTNPVVGDGATHHLAVVNNLEKGFVEVFLDGLSLGSAGGPFGLNGFCDEPIHVGSYGGGGAPWDGWIDEYAAWYGTARYTANFTPPTAPYTGKEGMTSLYHLDGNGLAATYTTP